MKFCSKCGNPLDNTKKFCNKCGAPNAFFVSASPVVPPNDDLAKLQIQKEQIERELEKKAQEEIQRKEQLRLNQEKAQKDAIERENIERRNREREIEAAELKRRQLDEILSQQNKEKEAREKEKRIEEQSEILQKVKLERELLERELDKIADLRFKKEQITKTIAAPPAVSASEPVQETKTGRRVLQIVASLCLLAGLTAGGFYAYQKFVLTDTLKQAIAEINAHQWSAAAQDLKKTIDTNDSLPAALQHSHTELENIGIWHTAAAQTAIAIQYPGILLSGSNPAAKDYINVLAKFKKIPFNQLSQNTLSGVNTTTALEPVYLLHDSVMLGLMQNILKDPSRLSVQNGSLLYNDGYEQLNEDTLEAGLLNKNNAAVATWYNQLLVQKSKVLAELSPAQVINTKPQPVQGYKQKLPEAKKAAPKPHPVSTEAEAPKRNAD